MIPSRRATTLFLSVASLLIYSSVALISQNTGRRSEAMIHQKVDENKLVTLRGNTRSEANAENDLGPVSDALEHGSHAASVKRAPHRSSRQRRSLWPICIMPKSPNFHKWMTAAEFGRNFGVADADIQAITAWLQSHGFTVNGVYPNGMVIDFSGSAGQVGRAFHTSIHHLDVNGVSHIANFSDPQIPAALAPAVAGVVSLHDFQPHAMKRAKYTFNYQGQPSQAVVPADLATIYDLNPLFAQGITGVGQTIAVIEDTDLYSAADWSTFRTTFGLDQYTAGSLTTVHPTSIERPEQLLRRRESSPVTTAKRFSMPSGPAPPRPARPSWWRPAATRESPSADSSPCRTS